MSSHRRHLLPSVAAAGALALAGTVALSPVAVAVSGETTSLPARTTSVPAADQVSGSGQAVVWRQKTAADTLAHG